MIKGEIDVSDLLRWGKALEGMPKKVKSAAARALNTYGDGVVTAAVRYLSNQTGLDASAIREKIEVKRATASNLSWEMDASAVVLETTDWSRPWEGRDDSNFDKSALVKIIAHEDCCEVCAEAAEDSPYTMEQVQQLAAKWAHFVPPHPVSGPRTNLIHPNCRCAVQPWSSMRKMPLTFGARGEMPPELLTMGQLGRQVAAELEVELKVKF